MYTNVIALPVDQPAGPPREGHAYDISESGVRIELDEPLAVGSSARLRLELPGAPADIAADGQVVWVNDFEDDPGPRRLAFRFTDFNTPADRDRLMRYIGTGLQRVAA